MPLVVTTRSPDFRLSINFACCLARCDCGRIVMKYIMTIMSTIKISGLPNNCWTGVGGGPGVPAGAAAGGVAVASASNAFNRFKCII